MNSFSILKSRQVGLFAVAGALLLALILPSIVSAAQLSARSIELSSSSLKATNVTYKVNFTAATVAGAVLVDFCKNSPLIGEECVAPVGLVISDSTNVEATANNTAVVTQAVTAGATSVTIPGVTNPDEAGTVYARIITYLDADTAGNYDPEQATDANRRDEGGAAISITNSIAVSGAVLESLTFCVSKVLPTSNCTGVSAPVLKLGQQIGDVFALVPDEVSEGSMYTQLTTNAAGGAVVSLKSSTIGCGGLLRAGYTNAATQCDIAPAGIANGADVVNGDAKFGVKIAAAPTDASGALNPSGTILPSAGYGSSAFTLNWVNGDNTGITSTFGDPFLNTNGLPVNNKNMLITFAAGVTSNTPAGLYSADLSLIATGKF